MNSSPAPTTALPKPITLRVANLGHVPSFKNGKMLARGRLITHPKKQKWMEEAAASIASQLRSLCPTSGSGTQTGQSLPSWIHTSLPLDDSLTWVGVTCGSWRRVRQGEEGAIITIERCGPDEPDTEDGEPEDDPVIQYPTKL